MEGILEAGLKTAAYWWQHPLEDWNRQLDAYLEQLDLYPVKFAAVDFEETHADQKIFDKKKNKYIWKYQVISGEQISNCGEYLTDGVIKEGHNPMTYTRKQYIDSFSPAMLKWINKYPIWLSAKPYEPCITDDRFESIIKGFKYCPTWDEWRAKYMLDPEGPWKVKLPTGVAKWDIWQFSFDCVRLPGSASYMDLNWVRKES